MASSFAIRMCTAMCYWRAAMAVIGSDFMMITDEPWDSCHNISEEVDFLQRPRVKGKTNPESHMTIEQRENWKRNLISQAGAAPERTLPVEGLLDLSKMDQSQLPHGERGLMPLIKVPRHPHASHRFEACTNSHRSLRSLMAEEEALKRTHHWALAGSLHHSSPTAAHETQIMLAEMGENGTHRGPVHRRNPHNSRHRMSHHSPHGKATTVPWTLPDSEMNHDGTHERGARHSKSHRTRRRKSHHSRRRKASSVTKTKPAHTRAVSYPPPYRPAPPPPPPTTTTTTTTNTLPPSPHGFFFDILEETLEGIQVTGRCPQDALWCGGCVQPNAGSTACGKCMGGYTLRNGRCVACEDVAWENQLGQNCPQIDTCSNEDYQGYSPNQACCHCGGGEVEATNFTYVVETPITNTSILLGYPYPRTAKRYAQDVDCNLQDLGLTINGITGALEFAENCTVVGCSFGTGPTASLEPFNVACTVIAFQEEGNASASFAFTATWIGYKYEILIVTPEAKVPALAYDFCEADVCDKPPPPPPQDLRRRRCPSHSYKHNAKGMHEYAPPDQSAEYKDQRPKSCPQDLHCCEDYVITPDLEYNYTSREYTHRRRRRQNAWKKQCSPIGINQWLDINSTTGELSVGDRKANDSALTGQYNLDGTTGAVCEIQANCCENISEATIVVYAPTPWPDFSYDYDLDQIALNKTSPTITANQVGGGLHHDEPTRWSIACVAYAGAGGIFLDGYGNFSFNNLTGVGTVDGQDVLYMDTATGSITLTPDSKLSDTMDNIETLATRRSIELSCRVFAYFEFLLRPDLNSSECCPPISNAAKFVISDDTCWFGASAKYRNLTSNSAYNTSSKCRSACRSEASCAAFLFSEPHCWFAGARCEDEISDDQCDTFIVQEKVFHCSSQSSCLNLDVPEHWYLSGVYCPRGFIGVHQVYQRNGSTWQDESYLIPYAFKRDSDVVNCSEGDYVIKMPDKDFDWSDPDGRMMEFYGSTLACVKTKNASPSDIIAAVYNEGDVDVLIFDGDGALLSDDSQVRLASVPCLRPGITANTSDGVEPGQNPAILVLDDQATDQPDDFWMHPCECFPNTWGANAPVTQLSLNAVPGNSSNKFRPDGISIAKGALVCDQLAIIATSNVDFSSQGQEITVDACEEECKATSNCSYYWFGTSPNSKSHCLLWSDCIALMREKGMEGELFHIPENDKFCHVADPEKCWQTTARRNFLGASDPSDPYKYAPQLKTCPTLELATQCDLKLLLGGEANGDVSACGMCPFVEANSHVWEGRRQEPAFYLAGTKLGASCWSERYASLPIRLETTVIPEVLTCVSGNWIDSTGSTQFENFECSSCIQMVQPPYAEYMEGSGQELYFLPTIKVQIWVDGPQQYYLDRNADLVSGDLSTSAGADDWIAQVTSDSDVYKQFKSLQNGKCLTTTANGTLDEEDCRLVDDDLLYKQLISPGALPNLLWSSFVAVTEGIIPASNLNGTAATWADPNDPLKGIEFEQNCTLYALTGFSFVTSGSDAGVTIAGVCGPAITIADTDVTSIVSPTSGTLTLAVNGDVQCLTKSSSTKVELADCDGTDLSQWSRMSATDPSKLANQDTSDGSRCLAFNESAGPYVYLTDCSGPNEWTLSSEGYLESSTSGGQVRLVLWTDGPACADNKALVPLAINSSECPSFVPDDCAPSTAVGDLCQADSNASACDTSEMLDNCNGTLDIYHKQSDSSVLMLCVDGDDFDTIPSCSWLTGGTVGATLVDVWTNEVVTNANVPVGCTGNQVLSSLAKTDDSWEFTCISVSNLGACLDKFTAAIDISPEATETKDSNLKALSLDCGDTSALQAFTSELTDARSSISFSYRCCPVGGVPTTVHATGERYTNETETWEGEYCPTYRDFVGRNVYQQRSSFKGTEPLPSYSLSFDVDGGKWCLTAANFAEECAMRTYANPLDTLLETDSWQALALTDFDMKPPRNEKTKRAYPTLLKFEVKNPSYAPECLDDATPGTVDFQNAKMYEVAQTLRDGHPCKYVGGITDDEESASKPSGLNTAKASTEGSVGSSAAKGNGAGEESDFSDLAGASEGTAKQGLAQATGNDYKDLDATNPEDVAGITYDNVNECFNREVSRNYYQGISSLTTGSIEHALDFADSIASNVCDAIPDVVAAVGGVGGAIKPGKICKAASTPGFHLPKLLTQAFQKVVDGVALHIDTNDCVGSQWGFSRAFCDLFCIKNAVKEGTSSVLESLTSAVNVLQTNFDLLMQYYSGLILDKLSTDEGQGGALLQVNSIKDIRSHIMAMLNDVESFASSAEFRPSHATAISRSLDKYRATVVQVLGNASLDDQALLPLVQQAEKIRGSASHAADRRLSSIASVGRRSVQFGRNVKTMLRSRTKMLGIYKHTSQEAKKMQLNLLQRTMPSLEEVMGALQQQSVRSVLLDLDSTWWAVRDKLDKYVEQEMRHAKILSHAANMLQAYTSKCSADWNTVIKAYHRVLLSEEETQKQLRSTWSDAMPLLGLLTSKVVDADALHLFAMHDAQNLELDEIPFPTEHAAGKIALTQKACRGRSFEHIQSAVQQRLVQGLYGQTSKQFAAIFDEMLMLRDRHHFNGMGQPLRLETFLQTAQRMQAAVNETKGVASLLAQDVSQRFGCAGHAEGA